MGVGFLLTGQYQPRQGRKTLAPEDWLRTIELWLEKDPLCHKLFINCRAAERAEQPALFVQFHLGGEEVEFVVPEPGRFQVSTKTSTLGAGYHTFLCDLLHDWGEQQGVTWDPPTEDSSGDDTGYFFTGDRAAVEAAMLQHLLVMATITLEMMDKGEFKSMAWAMPVGHHYDQFGPLLTLLGPRERDWIAAVRADPRQGIAAFPWWEEGTGSAFQLQRALCEMWLNVRWRTPLDEREQHEWENVHLDLCEAYRGDPTLKFPWREWLELLENLEADAVTLEEGDEEVEAIVRQRGAQEPDRPLIGYRRQPVRVDLADGWSITIPGEFAETWDDGLWKAGDATRTLWFNWWQLEAEDGSAPAAEDLLRAVPDPEGSGGEWLEHCEGDLVGRAVLQAQQEEEQLWNLCARSAVAGRLALCNIYYHGQDDRDWAIATWHSVMHTGQE